MSIRNITPVLFLGIILTEVIWGVDQLAKPAANSQTLAKNENPPRQLAGGGPPGEVLGLETFVPPEINLPRPLPEPLENIQASVSTAARAGRNGSTSSTMQKTVKIALLGDSMIDFLNDFPHLRDLLRSLNPSIKWEILNYGVGASNVGYGLYRVNSEYDYLGRHFQSLIGTNPDIVVVESFAYNHGDMPEAEYQKSLKRIFEELQKANKKIVFLATIAPSKANYARGAADWGDEYRSKEYEKTRRFMDLGIDAATQAGIPIVDAFHQSLDGDRGGNEKYIYGGDWIHPSPEGAEFIAKLLGPAIVSLIE